MHRGVIFKYSLGVFLMSLLSLSLNLSFPGISTLIAKGVYDAAFPLHDVSVRFEIPMRCLLVSISFTTILNLQRMETFSVQSLLSTELAFCDKITFPITYLKQVFKFMQIDFSSGKKTETNESWKFIQNLKTVLKLYEFIIIC